MPPDQPTTTEKPAPPDEVTPEVTPDAPPASKIEDVYGDFDAIEKAEPKPAASAPKKEAARPIPKVAKNAEAPSGQDLEAGSKKEKAASVSSAGSDVGRKEGFKTLSDEEYSKLDKTGRVSYNSSLRDQYSKVSRELHQLRAEFDKAKSRPSDDNRVKELQSLLEARDKRLKEAEEHLKLTAYERSEEFKERYQKPFLDAYTAGRAKASNLNVIERKNPDTDEVIQQTRRGTAEDFDRIMQIADDDQAYALAEQLFGPVRAMAIVHYREEIQELQAKSRGAIEERRTKSEQFEKESLERQKQQQEESERTTNERTALLRKHIEDGVKSHPEWFEPTEGDEESPKVIEAGKAIADSLFTGINPKTGKPYTSEGMVRFHAFVRNAVAAHGPLVHRLTAAKAKIAELEAELSEFKDSTTLEDAGRKGEGREESALPGEEEFYEVDRKSR